MTKHGRCESAKVETAKAHCMFSCASWGCHLHVRRCQLGSHNLAENVALAAGVDLAECKLYRTAVSSHLNACRGRASGLVARCLWPVELEQRSMANGQLEDVVMRELT